MLTDIRTMKEISDFVAGFSGDAVFSDPMAQTAEQLARNLNAALSQPAKCRVIGIYSGKELTGVFSFLVNPDEGYLEMLVGLSRKKRAYQEVLDWLRHRFPAYEADFVFNPNNRLLRKALEERGAGFDTEQLRLVWNRLCDGEAGNHVVVPYEESYREGYLALHRDEGRYWTGEKVIAAPDRFRIFLALRRGTVVGYIDVTYPYGENEPYDLFVCEEERRKGYGKALLRKALAANGSADMAALVETDNIPAIRLFRSLGFTDDPSGSSVLARLTL